MRNDTRLAATLRLMADAGRILASSFDYARTVGEVADLVVPAFASGFAVCALTDDGVALDVVARGDCSGAQPIELIAHGRPIGTLRIAGIRHAEIDRDAIDELGSRIAIAIDGARVFAREQPTALLLDRLPASPHLTFDAAYEPGAAEAFVGGDWYDAFALADGRIAISMGDVAGHGARAALVMGDVRNALRLVARACDDPAHALERVNGIVSARPESVIVTALFGIIDPAPNVLTYALAGHPAPVLAFAEGGALVLPGRGIPLGIDPELGTRNFTISLPPGSMSAFYTDGLIEITRDVIAGEARLIDAVRQELAERNLTPARSLVRRVLDGAVHPDDIAVLVVRTANDMPPDFTFTMTAMPTLVPVARRTLQRYLLHRGLHDNTRFAIVTAASEALANAVEHAFPGEPGNVTLAVRVGERAITVTIEDDGEWKPAERCDERGRGIQLMRAVMDSVNITTAGGRTTVVLTLAAD